MLRAIREIKPTWVIGENVSGIISWDGGMVFEQVQTDMETEGYEVWPYVLPACAVNAPHRRDRVWFIAHNESKGWSKGDGQTINTEKREMEKPGQEWNSIRDDFRTGNKAGSNATQNTISDGCIQRESVEEGTEIREQRNTCTGDTVGICISKGTIAHSTGNSRRYGVRDDRHESQKIQGKRFNEPKPTSDTESTGREWANGIQQPIRFKPGTWDNWPTVEPTIRSRNDGFSGGLAGITFSKHRNESIKAYGNAIVPQIALHIFKAIEQYENC